MLATAGVLLLAGVVAGVVGSAGGITSLVSYPALLAVGVPTLPANVTNLVAGAACWPGSALTSRREMAGSGARLRPSLPVAAFGAAVGAVLLLVTPPGAFAVIVPYLVATGAVALLAQPALTKVVRGRRGHALVPIGLIAVYGGYFGAGSGILTLAVLLVLVDPDLPRANALKNMLVGASTLAAGVVLAITGPVAWPLVAPLAVGLFAGSLVGPVV
ncbi:MAG TPA: sulfite exporter TauE/SafE family protein, partial [Pseudonocardia sp.]|nr:sulfite exporter TauE/SafE family protein [Pseudonocardia sp.]